MTKKRKTDPRVQETLAMLDEPQRVSADPYFYTRLSARMAEGSQSAKAGWFGWQRSFLKPAFFVLLFLLNLFTGYTYFSQGQTTDYSRSEYLSVFAEDFDMNDQPIYQINNDGQDY